MNKPFIQHAGAGLRQQGIALIEALVSLLIISLGFLGYIGLHLQLRASADVAKQRGEAMRIAQQDMERMRLFRSLDSLAGTSLYWGGTDSTKWGSDFRSVTDSPSSGSTISGSTSYEANTTYRLTRTVTTSSVADFKELQVKIAWTDRQGKDQSVVLRNVINLTDPSVAMSIGIVPNGSPVKDLLGRNVQIPIPAKNLNDGTSVFKPTSDATKAYVFSNETGEVTKVCTVSASTPTAQLQNSDLTRNCVNTTAYILSGFIRFYSSKGSDNFDPSITNDPQPSGTTWGVQLNLDNTAPPANGQGTLEQLTSAYWTSKTNAGYDAPSCFAEYSKTISYTGVVNYTITNNGTPTTTTSSTFYLTVPENLSLTPTDVAPYDGVRTSAQISNVKDTKERYVAYSCIVTPIDLDSNSATKKAWTGRPLLTVSGSGATIVANSSGYKVCRLSSDYNKNGYIWYPAQAPLDNSSVHVTKIDNEEHPYAYLNVSKAMSNQNYVVIQGDKSCPNLQSDSGGSGDAIEVDGTGSENYTDATTVVHQP